MEIEFIQIQPDQRIVRIYTDGSANKYIAGWGFVIVDGDRQNWFGRVVTDPTVPYCLGAKEEGNNTAELSSIIEAMFWVENVGDGIEYVNIIYDSKYAADSIWGNLHP
jgi:ribonuclease HI